MLLSNNAHYKKAQQKLKMNRISWLLNQKNPSSSVKFDTKVQLFKNIIAHLFSKSKTYSMNTFTTSTLHI